MFWVFGLRHTFNRFIWRFYKFVFYAASYTTNKIWWWWVRMCFYWSFVTIIYGTAKGFMFSAWVILSRICEILYLFESIHSIHVSIQPQILHLDQSWYDDFGYKYRIDEKTVGVIIFFGWTPNIDYILYHEMEFWEYMLLLFSFVSLIVEVVLYRVLFCHLHGKYEN